MDNNIARDNFASLLFDDASMIMRTRGWVSLPHLKDGNSDHQGVQTGASFNGGPMKSTVVIVVAAALGSCQDPRVAPLEARVSALEAALAAPPVAATPASTPEPTPPLELSLLSQLGPSFPAPAFALFDLSDEDRTSFPRDNDGFRVRRSKEGDELLVLGHMRVVEAPKSADSVLGDKMHSYSVTSRRGPSTPSPATSKRSTLGRCKSWASALRHGLVAC